MINSLHVHERHWSLVRVVSIIQCIWSAKRLPLIAQYILGVSDGYDLIFSSGNAFWWNSFANRSPGGYGHLGRPMFKALP